MKKKYWKVLIIGLLPIPLGIGSIVQAEESFEQSTQTAQTETSQTGTEQTTSSQTESSQEPPEIVLQSFFAPSFTL